MLFRSKNNKILTYKQRRNRASNYTKRPDIRDMVFSTYGYQCMMCGATTNLTIDHITSVFSNGSNELSNLQPLCRSCNSRKSP